MESTMTAQLDFYKEQAVKARAGAEAATLNNIRDRWLTSEASWLHLADRSARSEKIRNNPIAEGASEREVRTFPV
jgi:hypothetical protein